MPPQIHIKLTEAQIDMIAERAAAKALEKVYATVGKSVVKQAIFWIGAVGMAAAMYLKGKGVW